MRGFNVLLHVLRGVRPTIPSETDNEMKEWIAEFMVNQNKSINHVEELFEVSKQYLSLMKQCWAADFNERPEFSEICSRLSEMSVFKGYQSK